MELFDNNKLKTFEDKIKTSKNIVIIPHTNPDGDAIGSALGLYFALQESGKKIKIASPGNYPKFLKWLPGNSKINIFGCNKKASIERADLIICVDFNAEQRAGKLEDDILKSSAYKILIDHHPNPQDFTDLVFSDTSYSSTAELIYDILVKTEFKDNIDKNAAICLYTGILTDTGSFSYNSSNPNTFRVIADLLEKGIDKDVVYNNVYKNFSYDRMKFLGHTLLNRMKFLPEYNTAYIVITAKDRHNYKEKTGDTENFVNYPLSISDCIFSAIIIERENFIKMSFRSKGDFSAGEFAEKYFNGGGHKNASGGESHLSLEETERKFVESLKQYIKLNKDNSK